MRSTPTRKKSKRIVTKRRGVPKSPGIVNSPTGVFSKVGTNSKFSIESIQIKLNKFKIFS